MAKRSQAVSSLTAQLSRLNQAIRIPESFTADKRDKLLQELLYLYDLADGVMMSAREVNTDWAVEIAIPYVTQLRGSADIMTAFYYEIAFKGRTITKELQDTYAAASRNIFHAFDEFLTAMEARIPPQTLDPAATTVIDITHLTLGQLLDE